MLVTRLHGGGCAAQTAALAHAPRRARVACHWKGKNKGTPSSKHNVTNRSKRLAMEHTMALEQERVARGEDPEAQAPQLSLVLDGANLAWAYAGTQAGGKGRCRQAQQRGMPAPQALHRHACASVQYVHP